MTHHHKWSLKVKFESFEIIPYSQSTVPKLSFDTKFVILLPKLSELCQFKVRNPSGTHFEKSGFKQALWLVEGFSSLSDCLPYNFAYSSFDWMNWISRVVLSARRDHPGHGNTKHIGVLAGLQLHVQVKIEANFAPKAIKFSRGMLIKMHFIDIYDGFYTKSK